MCQHEHENHLKREHFGIARTIPMSKLFCIFHPELSVNPNPTACYSINLHQSKKKKHQQQECKEKKIRKGADKMKWNENIHFSWNLVYLFTLLNAMRS